MAMLPFCGYNMADYFSHWLSIKDKVKNPPAIFRVNWFRKDEHGKFMWPGYGQNMRALAWIVDRARGRGEAVEGPFGFMPRYQDIKWDGLAYDKATFQSLMQIDRTQALREIDDQKSLFDRFGSRTPATLIKQQDEVRKRVESAAEIWNPAV
jgi:phosphoenolpyruvate carboxykinase (GTP)